MAIYVVKEGDSIDKIAKLYKIATEPIIFDNQLAPPYALAVGQALYISTGQEKKKGEIRTNGYAYPFISSWVLEETLPYLTALSIFSYGFTMEGDLISPPLKDQWMIENAWEMGVNPILTLTPFGPDGRFNNRLISSVVNDEIAKENLIKQLIKKVEEKGFAGVDVDFEYILASDRDAFTVFVVDLRKVMNELGKQVSVALAPKTSSNQKGLLFEGKDYKGLGEASNRVLLMTYEYGYKYGPNMAVAPIDQVRKVVEYAVTEIPREKINLGIPNYGYDWPLPFEKGVTVARTIGNVEAVQIAIDKGVSIQFDEVAKSPFFRYTEKEIIHEVWFEDVRSIQAKMDLIREFQLEGAGYWQINQLFRANWLIVDNNFSIKNNL